MTTHNPNVTVVDVAAMEARLHPLDAPITASAVREPNGEWTVAAEVVGTDLDRPQVRAWGLGPNHARLAQRLVAAINAGAVLYDLRQGTDVDGRTYATASARVLGRTLNADLRRLGY